MIPLNLPVGTKLRYSDRSGTGDPRLKNQVGTIASVDPGDREQPYSIRFPNCPIATWPMRHRLTLVSNIRRYNSNSCGA